VFGLVVDELRCWLILEIILVVLGDWRGVEGRVVYLRLLCFLNRVGCHVHFMALLLGGLGDAEVVGQVLVAWWHGGLDLGLVCLLLVLVCLLLVLLLLLYLSMLLLNLGVDARLTRALATFDVSIND